MTDGIHATSDIYYAAYLKVAGLPFRGTEREGSRVLFQFEAPDASSLKDLKNQYYSRKAKVVAMDYADEVRAMKNLTHTT